LFRRTTVLPLASRIGGALTQWLSPAFGTGLALAIDTDRIEALSPERAALWDRVTKAPFVIAKEKRAATGFGGERCWDVFQNYEEMEQVMRLAVLLMKPHAEAFNLWNRGGIMTSKLILATGLAAALAFSASGNAQAAEKDSQKFIKAAIEGNYAEIDNGKLAQEKGNNDAVKQFGAMLVKDHSASNEKAIDVAKQLGVDPPSGSGVTAKAEYLKLKVLSGDTFDRSFVKGMVKDHQNDVKEYETEASAKTDAAAAFAKETLPTLKHHLREAQSLEQKTHATTGSK
jgi:putative membrane protein